MKASSLFRLLCLGALAMLFLSSAPAEIASASGKPDEKAKKGPPEKEKIAWKSLFDGKTLTGWKSTNFGGEGEVLVEDGVLLLETGSDMTGVTYAGKDFPKLDYEVEMVAKRVKGSDFFCTTTFPVGKDFCSLVVGGWAGPVVGLSSINDRDASENGTKTLQDFERGRWYKVRIRVRADRISAWIDEKKVVDLDPRGKKISTRPECDPCRPFGIATWRTVGAIREVRVRLLGVD